MEIKKNNEVIGSIYVNISLSKEKFSKDSLKNLEDHTFELNGGTFKIVSFKNVYECVNNIHLEGAVLNLIK